MTLAATDARVRPDLLHVASGWSLLVTDPLGRMSGGRTCGFYADNTRVLSHERLTVDDAEIAPFACARVGSSALVTHAERGAGAVLPPRALYLTVERFVGRGLRTVLRFDSYSDEDVSLALCVELGADFVDEVERGERQQTAPVRSAWDGSELRLTYDHPDLDRAVVVRVEPGDTDVAWEAGALRGVVDLRPRASAVLAYVVEPVVDGRRGAAPVASFAEGDDAAGRARQEIRADTTGLVTTNTDVALAWRTAVNDLASLALGDEAGPAAPSAGTPLYQQVFGRDVLTASWQALLATAVPLRDSLRLNAAHIGRRLDDWHDEEPGKMLHQARRGPLAVLGLDPLTAYYGDRARLPRLPRSVLRVDRRPLHGAGAPADGAAGAALARGLRRPGPGRVPGVRHALRGRRQEPGMEGLRRRRRQPGRHARAEPDRDQRAAGLPLRRAAARRGRDRRLR
jgi:hypothetical protein